MESQAQIDSLTDRMTLLELKQVDTLAALKANTELTKQVQSDTSEIVEFFRHAKNGAKIIVKLSDVARWIAKVGGAVVVIWGILWGIKHGGVPPVIGGQ